MLPSSLIRALTAVAGTLCGAVVLLGLAITPTAVLVAVAVVTSLTGLGVAMTVHGTSRSTASAVRGGVAAAAAAFIAGLVITGLVALLGVTALPVLLLLSAAVGIWVRRRRGTWVGHARRAWTGHPVGVTPPRPDRRAAPQGAGAATVNVAAATCTLCAAWQRTYWLLHDLPLDSPQRLVVVRVRRQLLDELERRDPAGFGQWLHTEPRACSNPGRYLSAG